MLIPRWNQKRALTKLTTLLLFMAILPGCTRSTPKAEPLRIKPVQFGLHFTQEMSSSECRLIERYYSKDIKRLEYPGTLNLDEFSCTVTLPIEQYEKELSFCYLAGFTQLKTTGSEEVECFVQRGVDSYQFKTGIRFPAKMSSLLICYFSCIGENEPGKFAHE